MTKATVLMVAYNRAVLLERCLNSLLPQMKAGDQLVVVDDGSTDDSEARVQVLCPDATYVRIPENEGYRLSTRINQGLSVATNDMVWRLDCDCVPYEDCLEMLRELHRNDRLIAGAVQYMDERGKIPHADHAWRLRRLEALRERVPGQHQYWTRTAEVFDPAFCFGGNLCFSRDVAIACGGFDADFDGGWGAEDAWFAEKMMFKHGARLLYVPGVAVVHQWHSKEGSHRAEEALTRNFQLWESKSWALRWGNHVRGTGGTWKPPAPEGSLASQVAPAPYALLTITGPDMVNAGNLVVELSLLRELPEPAIVASVFQEPTREAVAAIIQARCRKVICAGTTVYGDGTPLRKWAEALGDIPITVIGGCLWSADRGDPASFSAQNMRLTARDPFTVRHLAADGAMPYVGCPSLLLQPVKAHGVRAKGKRLGLGFHRKEIVRQLDMFESLLLTTGRPATILVQERHELMAARLFQDELEGKADVEVAILANMRTLPEWCELFGSLELCISGRLHQVLPAVAMGVPSVLFVPAAEDFRDSRYTLVEDLGIPTACLDDVGFLELPGLCGTAVEERIEVCRESMTAYLKRFVDALAP
jgi:GT2 family glycosyltransferase